MKQLNESKQHYSIKLDKITLCPYKKQHVPMYNSWMDDSQLLLFTGSEKLTLQQEYQCQHQWTIDKTRDTFIILYDGTPVGDVNIFFSEWLQPNEAEINVMIADSGFRGKGIATTVIQMM